MSSRQSVANVWRDHELPAAILASATLVGLVVAGASLLVDPLLVVRPGDAPKYFQIARAPFDATDVPSAPFRYRVVTPTLAWLLPTSRLTGFAVVNLSALTAAGVVGYAYLRDLGFGVRRAAFGLALFVVSPAVAYLSTNLVLVDGVTMFMLACVFWAAYRDRLLVFALLLALGVATKESVLFALPIYGLYCLQRRGVRGVVRPIAAAIPAGVMYLGLRVFYGFSGDTLGAIVARGVGAQLDKFAMSVFYIPYEVYSAFGTLWVLAALYGVVTLPKVVRERSVDRRTAFLAAGIAVVPLAFLQPLIARNITRVLFIAFPVVIPTALLGIESLSRRLRLAFCGFAALAGLAGIAGALVVLPSLAGSVESVSLPAIQYLALVGAANELVVILAVLAGGSADTGAGEPSAPPLRTESRSRAD
ncbi:hypothetical protein [Halococcus hamelinensis]|uniref:Glycosyltransferase RgtA/B/C/D-like domain-containing protein n=1 Tax=Halococcus hamelinensis 100A6 TaxID=1132509 RepID=M0M1A9_9EURY|nr:hypothetical protein [Halococcus hamelinensis]EMA38394.1 hypothetical protein C447_09567 [Halococcus hamelinensis 100A6]